jgi:hypothetical protein
VLASGVLGVAFRPVAYLTADDIIQKVKESHAAKSEIDLIKMVTLSSTGELESRQIFSAVQIDPKGNYSYLLRFLSPDDERGISLLVIEKDADNVDQYLYLPALGEPRKIEGKSRSGYFMGSDFTYEDLRKEKPNEWVYNRLQDDQVDGMDCYVILSAPVDKDRERTTGYTNRMLYVDKATFNIRRIEFFNSKNQRLKVFDAYDYYAAPGEPMRPHRLVMTNNTKNTTTVMSLLSSHINQPLDSKFFTLDTLTKWGPAQEQILQQLMPASKPTAADIIHQVQTTHADKSELDLVKMVTLSSTGELESRQVFSAVQIDPKGNYSYLLRFLSPDNERGISLLVLEKDAENVDQYLYLPGLGELRKIEGRSRSGYFMDTDFTYEDFRKEKPNEWSYNRLQDDKVDDMDCYVILSDPVDKDRERITGYTDRMLYVDKNTFNIRRIEFFNSKNERLKVFDAYDYQTAPGEPPRPHRLVMTNNTKNTTTVMSLVNSRVNEPLDNKLFSLDTLTKWGPAQDQLLEQLQPSISSPSTP